MSFHIPQRKLVLSVAVVAALLPAAASAQAAVVFVHADTGVQPLG